MLPALRRYLIRRYLTHAMRPSRKAVLRLKKSAVIATFAACRGLTGSAQSLAIAEYSEQSHHSLVIVAPTARKRACCNRNRVLPRRHGACYTISGLGVSALRFVLPHRDVISQRLRALYRFPSLDAGIMIVTASTLLQRLPPRSYVEAHSFFIARGDRLNLDQLRHRLTEGAYQAVSEVTAPGEFAVRGGIIDVYPMGSREPFRIDLFDDEVDSIRYFDPNSQRTTETTDTIELLPAREFPMTETAIRDFRQAFRRSFEGDPQKQIIYKDVSKGFIPAGVEFYLPLFFPELATLADYVPTNTLWIHDGDSADSLADYWGVVNDRYEGARLDHDRRVLPPDHLYLSPQEVTAAIGAHPQITLINDSDGDDKNNTQVQFDTHMPPDVRVDPKADHPYERLLEQLKHSGRRTLIVAESPGRREMIDGVLRENSMKAQDIDDWKTFVDSKDAIALTVAPVERGMHLIDASICVLTETDLYGQQVKQKRRRSAASRDPETIIRSLADLQIGSPVVHDTHGIGRYQGLQPLISTATTSSF